MAFYNSQVLIKVDVVLRFEMMEKVESIFQFAPLSMRSLDIICQHLSWKSRRRLVLLLRIKRISSLKIPDMSDHIENEGKKGKTVMWIFIYIMLFIFLLIYLYQYNFKMTF
jgi:hypothetical protein